ncbi:hypothetical protein J4211_05415 [Candidatus Woesearchaeota archaeon]|nr:hypothetical protein [Candidatus Woesearchaeota archaeon]
MLEYLAFILFVLCVIVGILTSIIGFSGPFLVVIGAVMFDIITWSQSISFWSIGLVFMLAVAGELIEAFILYHAGKKLSPLGKEGMLSGAIFIGKLFTKKRWRFGGMLAGGVLGTFLGEWASGKSAKIAWNNVKSLLFQKVLASVIKIVIIFVQVWIVLWELIHV